MLKKALFFSVALSAPFLCATLYGSDITPEMDVELTLKKRPAQRESGESINKKQKIDTSGGDLDLVLEQTTVASEDNFFDIAPEDMIFYILSFLNIQDKNHFALASKTTYKTARNALIYTDIRGLKDKEWANGPTKGTFENYLFNSILWKMGHTIFKNKTNDGTISIPHAAPLLRGGYALADRFGHLKISEAILEGFISAEQFSKSVNGKAMAERAKSHPKGGEDDFLSLVHYLSPNGETYTLPQDVSTPMGLVERFHRVRSAYTDLMNQTLTWDAKASQGDFLLTYDLEPTTIETIQQTATAHYHTGLSPNNPSQKLDHFKRAAELMDTVLENWGASAELTEIQNAASAHYNVGTASFEPSQTIASFTRAAELYEVALDQLDEGATATQIQNAANAHYGVGTASFDPSQKLISLTRAAELYEATLEKMGAGAQAPDITYAANAYFKVGEASNEPSQKLASFTRAAKLFDRIFALNPDQPITYLKASVTVYDFIGDPDKANEIRTRIASLPAFQKAS